jgi:hypothetical protein
VEAAVPTSTNRAAQGRSGEANKQAAAHRLHVTRSTTAAARLTSGFAKAAATSATGAGVKAGTGANAWGTGGSVATAVPAAALATDWETSATAGVTVNTVVQGEHVAATGAPAVHDEEAADSDAAARRGDCTEATNNGPATERDATTRAAAFPAGVAARVAAASAADMGAKTGHYALPAGQTGGPASGVGEAAPVAETVARAAAATTTAPGQSGGATGRPVVAAAGESATAAETTARAAAEVVETVSGLNVAAGRPAAAAIAGSEPAKMGTTAAKAAATVPAAGQSRAAGRPAAAAASEAATVVKMAQAAAAETVPMPSSTTGGKANDQNRGTGPIGDQTVGGKSARAANAAPEHGGVGDAGDWVRSGGAVVLAADR